MDELVRLMASVDEKVQECIEQCIELHKAGLLSAIELDKILQIARTENREQSLFEYHKML